MNSFDITAVSDINQLNNVFHKLANSDIFKQREDGYYTYTFGKFLYQKVKPVLTSFDLGGNKNLIKDPDTWDIAYGNRPGDGGTIDPYFEEYYNLFATEGEKNGSEPTYYLLYRDFVSINSSSPRDNAAAWCNNAQFETKYEAFIPSESWKTDNEYNAIYGSDAFVAAYQEIFDLDELGRLCKILTYALRLKNLASFDLDNLNGNLLGGILTALNESTCLNIGVYNVCNIAKDLVAENPEASNIINLDAARFDYLIANNDARNDLDNYRNDRQFEIDTLVGCLDTYQLLKDKGVVNGESFDASKFDSETLIKSRDMVTNLNKSYVFHRLGSAIEGEGYQPTVFQGLMDKLISQTPLKDEMYNDASPKDVAQTPIYQEYMDKEWVISDGLERNMAKTDYLLNTVFVELSDNPEIDEVEWEKQINEIDKFFETFAIVYGYEYNGVAHEMMLSPDKNFLEIDPQTINPELVGVVLKHFTTTELLQDAAPNLLKTVFSNVTFSSEIEVNFNRASPYYFYSYNGNMSTDYTRVLPDEEIDRVVEIIMDYQDFTTILADRNFVNKAVITELNNSGIAEQILTHMHNSEMFHLYNERNVDLSDQLTVFEQFIKTIMDKTQLSEYAYDSTRDATFGSPSNKMFRKIKQLSTMERNDATPLYSYHNSWVGDNQEIKCLIDFTNHVLSLADTTLEFDNIDLSNKSPALISGMLQKMNKIDVAADAVCYFAKDILGKTSLDQLCEFDGVNYAYYFHNQKVYGGVDGNAGEGTEIYLIRGAMENLSKEDDGSYSYYDATNIADFTSEVTNFDNMMRFVSQSLILNTNISTGQANTLNEFGYGLKISARGVLMYNIFSGGATGISCGNYITGSTDLQKAHAMSAIFNLDDFNYVVESRGLQKIIEAAGDLDPVSFDATNIDNIKTKSVVISNLIGDAYNAYENKRSYFVSEIVGGVLEEAFATERARINTLGLTCGNPDYMFKAANCDEITIDSYNNINETEKNGFEGSINLLSIIDKLVGGNAITNEEIADSFGKMDGSEIARVYFASRGYKQYPSESMRLDFTQSAAAVALYGDVWTDYSQGENVWASTFSFANYGNSFGNYLGI